MIRILCYGDSNTWGANAYSTERYEATDQWPRVLATLYDGHAEVVQEGLGGRTAGDCDTEKPYYHGKTGFEIALRSAMPVDYIVVALGVNDLKSRYGRTADQVVADLLWYEGAAQDWAAAKRWRVPQVLYALLPNYENNEYFDGPQELRHQINEQLRRSGRPYISLEDLELSADKLHWSIRAHGVVAHRVKEAIDALRHGR